MKLLKTLSATVIALSISTAVMAEVDSQHVVGFQVGGGGLEYKGKSTDDRGTGQAYLYYNYKFMPQYYLEVGLSSGSDADWDCEKDSKNKWHCDADDHKFDLEADDFKYTALVIALKTDLALSERNSLYGKLGASYYDYSVDLNKNKIADKNGIGFVAEAGWEYRWDNGMGMNAGIQYQDMGDLEMKTLNIGINYAF
jgi:opacity protein-like surface antigen